MTANPVLSLADPQVVVALVTLLEEQRALFAQLRELSAQQASLVAEGAADELLAVLAQRQSAINDLMASNEKLEPYRRDWVRLYAELDEAQRRRVGALLQEVQQSLGAIIAQDERDRQSLQSQQSNISSELQGMTRVGSAVQAYRNAPRTVNPRFTDHQG
jgi:sensor domain CHASE-containing protein